MQVQNSIPNRPIVNTETLKRYLYIAVSLLLADERVDELGDEFLWSGDFYEDEVRRVLLWVAVGTRSLLGVRGSKPELEGRNCGYYWARDTGKKPTVLSLRQACNSLVHARTMFLYDDPLNHSKPYGKMLFSKHITVYGALDNRPPRAKIDVIRFAKSINQLLIHLGE